MACMGLWVTFYFLPTVTQCIAVCAAAHATSDRNSGPSGSDEIVICYLLRRRQDGCTLCCSNCPAVYWSGALDTSHFAAEAKTA